MPRPCGPKSDVHCCQGAVQFTSSGVGIGRLYIWGLSAFGQEGVERVLEILRAELTITMKQIGTPLNF